MKFPRYFAVIGQLCSLQSGLEQHACKECNHKSLSNTEIISYHFFSAVEILKDSPSIDCLLPMWKLNFVKKKSRTIRSLRHFLECE